MAQHKISFISFTIINNTAIRCTFERTNFTMRLLLLTFMLLPGMDLLAQYPKWIVRFTDKNNSSYSIGNPSAYLSQKAIDRRTKQRIAIDSSDLPVNPSYIEQVLAQGNVTYLSQSRWLNQILISCKDNKTINAINQLAFVKTTEAIGYLKTTQPFEEKREEDIKKINVNAFVNTATQDSLQYGTTYNQVHMHEGEYLHNKGFTGKGITIAVLDAGFYHYKELKAFDSIRLQNRVLGERDFVDNDNSVNEDNAHGMYCLSTIAANMPDTMTGTAPHASFWLMRTENAFSEYPIEEHNWAAAAAFADSAGADMISSSLGYYYFDDPAFNHSYDNFYNNSTMVSNAAAIAAKKGMIVTNSAGNEGAHNWHYILFPADADSVCTVGAVNRNGVIASFSSYGYPGKVKPNVVSVGEGTIIMGTDNLPVAGNGTSFSNPNINGLIACLWQAFPGYNNMTILDAVYQSADRFNDPDSRYGFGIPNMKQAYIILKKKQNTEIYGNDWLIASPDLFTNRIEIKVIAQKEGSITLSLLNKDGNAVAALTLTAEEQEIYDTAFVALDRLPAGNYTVQYKDGENTRSVIVTKQGIVMKDWLVAAPVPFNTQLTVYLKAPETGSIQVRLIDASGKILEATNLNTEQNNYYSIPLKTAPSLPEAVYFVQYAGTQKKTIKVLK